MSRYQIISDAESAARALLRRHRIDSVPVDLRVICRGEGLTCVEKELDDELSGMSFVKNDIRYVIVNSAHHVNRRRFTMAHEIGHHIMHADYLTKNVHVDTGILRRDELSSEGVYSKEVAANAFAAELLMPKTQMGRFASLDLSDESRVIAAAKMFGVSVAAFTYRVSNLARS